jgi:chorismate mutase
MAHGPAGAGGGRATKARRGKPGGGSGGDRPGARGLRAARPAAPSTPGSANIPPGDPFEELRQRIDAIDRKMVGLLNERAAHAIALGRIKKERGLPIYQPAREEEVLRNVQENNDGPLEDGALRRLFERIIDESRHIERSTTAGPAGAGAAARSAGDLPTAPDPDDPVVSSD